MKKKRISWIKEIDPSTSKELHAIYEREEKRTKSPIANVLRVHSIKPKTLDAHLQLYNTIMFGESKLSRAQREMIGIVVSEANSCPYCVSHHGNAYYFVTHEKKKMKKIAKDFRNADLDEIDRVICEYAEKLTKNSYKMTEDDIKKMRSLGLSDAAIFEVNQVCAYFNYVNRIVHGLGVDLETGIETVVDDERQ